MSAIINEGTMEYRVCRNAIYVGRVVKSIDKSHININYEDRYFFNDLEEFRSTFFVLDEKGNAIDLFFRTPSYPVLGHVDNSIIDNSAVFIKDAVSMKPVFDFFQLNNLLYYEDVLSVKNILFSSSFVQNNLEAFGLNRNNITSILEPTVLFDNNGFLTEDFKLAIKKLIELKEKSNNMLVKDLVKEGYIPLEYIIVLDNLRRMSEISKSHNHFFSRRDAFSKVKEEGPVKKLRNLM